MTLVVNTGGRFAGYTNIGEFQFKSASGIAQQTETIQVGAIQIDDVIFSNVKIGRATFAHAENTLGIDILGRRAFSLIFKPKPVLQLNASRVELPLTTLETPAHGLLSIPVSIGGSEVRALWDTGASLTFVDQAFIQANAEDFKATKNYMNGVDGAGKKMLVQIFRAKKIAIGERTFTDIHVGAGDLSLLRDNVAKDIQAVVGFNLIRKANWYFDGKLRLWKCSGE